MSFTRKPCPACGKVNPYRKPDTICGDCKKKLEWADQKESEMAQLMPSEVVVPIGELPHWNQYIPRGKEILTRLHQLVMGVSRRTGVNRYLSGTGILGTIEGGGGIEIALDPQVAEIVPQLLTEIQSALDAAYQEGKADGHHILVRLAADDISLSEFERQTGVIKTYANLNH